MKLASKMELQEDRHAYGGELFLCSCCMITAQGIDLEMQCKFYAQ